MGNYYSGMMLNEKSLQHHGIKGQKWGVRRYQNPDGTLTEAGKKHYYGDKNANSDSIYSLNAKQRYQFNKITEKEFNKAYKKSAYNDRHSKYGAREGRPSEIDAAYNTKARKVISNTNELREKKEQLYNAAKPEIEFENNERLWKKYGYDPEDPSFETVHDVHDSYWDAKERYMSDKGLAYGSDARREYEDKKKEAYRDYNYEVDYAVNSMLGYYGNVPVSVTTKWGNTYYAVAREAIAKSLKYGYYADSSLDGGGHLDFYSLADDYYKDHKDEFE